MNSKIEQGLQLLSEGLRPMVGHIVRTRREDVVIDLGSYDGIAVGDLFSVYVKDGPVQAPSKDGMYEKLRAGVLKAVEVQANETKCVVVVRTRPIPTGSEVERFSGLNAAFMAENPGEHSGAQALEASLKERLWWLNWPESNMLPSSFKGLKGGVARLGIDIVFVASKDGIDLYDPTLEKIRHYPLDLTPFFERKGLVEVNLKSLDANRFRRIGELDLDASQALILDCNKNCVPEVYILSSRGVFAQEYGQGSTRYIESTASTSYKDTVGISMSCKRGLLAINREEPGVGLHSSVLDISGNTPLVLCEDVNLWLGFYALGKGDDEVLLAQGPRDSGARGQEGSVMVLGSCNEGPAYSGELGVPEGFHLSSGWIWRDYTFYRDAKGEWILGHMGKKGVDWTRPIMLQSTGGFKPRFSAACAVKIGGEPGVIVPGYNPSASISRLYFISMYTFKGSIFSDPLDGEVIGLGILGPKLYLAVSQGSAKTVLYEALIQRDLGTQ